jgi:hypothetical protein
MKKNINIVFVKEESFVVRYPRPGSCELLGMQEKLPKASLDMVVDCIIVSFYPGSGETLTH